MRSYTVKLSSQPTSTVTVSVTVPSAHTDAVRVSTGSLTFFATIWNLPQTVTVTARDDSDTVSESGVEISHTVSSSDSNYPSTLSAPSVLVNVTDDDSSLGSVIVSRSSLDVDEGSTGSYTVRLSSAPSVNVTVRAASDDTGAVSVSPATRTFTSSNWSTVQSFTVRGVQDSDFDDENNVAVRHSVSSSDAGYPPSLSVQTVRVDVDDIDTPVVVNSAPRFGSSSQTLWVTESDDYTGATVGTVSATDSDGDTLTYTLGGTDAARFAIGGSSGRVTVGSGTTFDYDTKNAYVLRVTATDPGGLSDSIAVTVRVVNPNPPGERLSDAVPAVLNGAAASHVLGDRGVRYHSVSVVEGYRYRIAVIPQNDSSVFAVTIRDLSNREIGRVIKTDGRWVLEWTADRTSTVYIRVNGIAGAYQYRTTALSPTVSWNEYPDDWTTTDIAGDVPPNTTTTAVATRGTSYQGVIDFAGDTDYVKVDLEAGTTYVIVMLGAGSDEPENGDWGHQASPCTVPASETSPAPTAQNSTPTIPAGGFGPRRCGFQSQATAHT